MKSRNIKYRLLINLLLWGVSISQMVYNSSFYTLGPNLIKDSTFSDYPLPSDVKSVIYKTTMASWTCNRNCKLIRPYNICIQNSITCKTTSSILAIDLDSKEFSNISQTINITSSGQYIIYV